MTATVTKTTISVVQSSSDAYLSSGVGFVAILLLIVLLIYKEVVRSFDGPRSGIWMRSLDTVIGPVFLAFAFIMALRFLDLLLPIL